MTETISHYRIVRELGRGGMGRVYLAEDTRLHRMVALKLLAPEAAHDARRRQRFLREAHAASIVSHPNIAVIHEVGETADSGPFIAMEYVEGRTLDEVIGSKPLALNQILDIALEIADALDEAHGRGVIHRDLKPANIIINTRGHAKVLDFGLAKVGEQIAGETSATALKSDAGLVLGTVHYMSPEQALGREVDPRSDLFSFGVILYEMATGRRPFEGASGTEVIERLVHQQPEAVARLNYNVPAELERIIRKSLEKDRDWRYQSAREVIVDLKSLRRDSSSGERVTPPPKRIPRALMAGTIALLVIGAAIAMMMTRRAPEAGVVASEPRPRVVSIAVLPFSKMSAAAEAEHLQYALPDEVTTILSYNTDVAVRPFTTTRRLVDSDPIEAGRNLKVDKIVTGSYRTGEGQIAITVEAIDVPSNRVLWRDNIDGSAAELIALRGALSSRVRAGLLPALGVAESAKESAQPKNSEAYSLYLNAVGLSPDREPTRKALALLERAVALDPDFAPAWAQKATRHYFIAQYDRGGRESINSARAAALRSLELDPDYIQPARSLAIYEAEAGNIAQAYVRALAMVRRNPRNADSHFVVSYVLRYAGRLEDAARECETAMSLNSFAGLRSCSIVYQHLGNHERARHFLRLDGSTEWAASHHSRMLIKEGKTAEALEAIEKIESRTSVVTLMPGCLRGEPVDTSVTDDNAAAAIDCEQAYMLAEVLAFCGDVDRAFTLLRRALENGYSIYPAIDRNPLYKPLRADPRWAELRDDAIRYRDRINDELLRIEQSDRASARQ